MAEMTDADVRVFTLNQRIAQINKANDNFDLAWEWFGNDAEPAIRVYEEAENHDLAGGTMDTIQASITEALPLWQLIDPDDG